MAPWSPLQERAAHLILASDFLFWAMTKVAPGFATRTLLATDPDIVAAAGPAEQARVQAILDGILPVTRRSEGLLNDARETGGAVLDYGAIRVPTLAVALDDDLFDTDEGARMLAEIVPEAELVIYPSGGHVWVGREASSPPSTHSSAASGTVRPDPRAVRIRSRRRLRVPSNR
jgi:2-hydroxy-6-oxonona-2,4-dienedioate hydrolase